MDENKKSSAAASAITEIVIAGVLVFLILATLNYFGILPLSKTLPFLSFLPSQAKNTAQYTIPTSTTTSSAASITTLTLVRPVDPKKLVNNKSDFLFSPIASSSVKVTGTMRIDLELADVRTATATQGSGLMFKNNLKFDDPGYRHLRVFYYPQNKTWSLEVRSKNKSQYFQLKRANATGPNFGKFAFIISPQGKAITMLVGGQKSKTVQLNNSLYDSGSNMTMTAHVGPRSELDIYGLYYQY